MQQPQQKLLQHFFHRGKACVEEAFCLSVMCPLCMLKENTPSCTSGALAMYSATQDSSFRSLEGRCQMPVPLPPPPPIPKEISSPEGDMCSAGAMKCAKNTKK